MRYAHVHMAVHEQSHAQSTIWKKERKKEVVKKQSTERNSTYSRIYTIAIDRHTHIYINAYTPASTA